MNLDKKEVQRLIDMGAVLGPSAKLPTFAGIDAGIKETLLASYPELRGNNQLRGVPNMLVSVELPFPPSLNNLYINVPGRGRVLSKRGKAFKKAVHACCDAQDVQHAIGKLEVTILAYPPDKRRRDVDGLFKAILDSLQAAGVFDDDSQVEVLTIRRCAIVKGGAVIVNIRGEMPK